MYWGRRDAWRTNCYTGAVLHFIPFINFFKCFSYVLQQFFIQPYPPAAHVCPCRTLFIRVWQCFGVCFFALRLPFFKPQHRHIYTRHKRHNSGFIDNGNGCFASNFCGRYADAPARCAAQVVLIGCTFGRSGCVPDAAT